MGARRTSVWFGVLGAVILVLGLPFAIPVDRDVVEGDYPTLNDAAGDTLLTWPAWSLDLSGWDATCEAPRQQPGMASLYAKCVSGTVDVIGTGPVDPSDGESTVAHAADRAARAAWVQDVGELGFRSDDAEKLLHSSVASHVTTTVVSDTVEFTYDEAPSSPNDTGSFGEGFGGGLQNVAVQRAANEVPTARSRNLYVKAAAIVNDSADHTMYTVIVSGHDPLRVQTSLSLLLKGIR